MAEASSTTGESSFAYSYYSSFADAAKTALSPEESAERLEQWSGVGAPPWAKDEREAYGAYGVYTPHPEAAPSSPPAPVVTDEQALQRLASMRVIESSELLPPFELKGAGNFGAVIGCKMLDPDAASTPAKSRGRGRKKHRKDDVPAQGGLIDVVVKISTRQDGLDVAEAALARAIPPHPCVIPIIGLVRHFGHVIPGKGIPQGMENAMGFVMPDCGIDGTHALPFRDTRLDEDNMLMCALQMIAAVDHVHKQGLLHLDIALRNFIFLLHNTTPVPLLLYKKHSGHNHLRSPSARPADKPLSRSRARKQIRRRQARSKSRNGAPKKHVEESVLPAKTACKGGNARGRKYDVRLTDFGLAREMAALPANMPRFVPPCTWPHEFFARQFSTAGEVWQVAILLWEFCRATVGICQKRGPLTYDPFITLHEIVDPINGSALLARSKATAVGQALVDDLRAIGKKVPPVIIEQLELALRENPEERCTLRDMASAILGALAARAHLQPGPDMIEFASSLVATMNAPPSAAG